MLEEKAIYHYILSITLGYGVAGSKRLFNNDKFFKKVGIDVDFSHRPMWKDRKEILNWIEKTEFLHKKATWLSLSGL